MDTIKHPETEAEIMAALPIEHAARFTKALYAVADKPGARAGVIALWKARAVAERFGEDSTEYAAFLADGGATFTVPPMTPKELGARLVEKVMESDRKVKALRAQADAEADMTRKLIKMAVDTGVRGVRTDLRMGLGISNQALDSRLKTLEKRKAA